MQPSSANSGTAAPPSRLARTVKSGLDSVSSTGLGVTASTVMAISSCDSTAVFNTSCSSGRSSRVGSARGSGGLTSGGLNSCGPASSSPPAAAVSALVTAAAATTAAAAPPVTTTATVSAAELPAGAATVSEAVLLACVEEPDSPGPQNLGAGSVDIDEDVVCGEDDSSSGDNNATRPDDDDDGIFGDDNNVEDEGCSRRNHAAAMRLETQRHSAQTTTAALLRALDATGQNNGGGAGGSARSMAYSLPVAAAVTAVYGQGAGGGGPPAPTPLTTSARLVMTRPLVEEPLDGSAAVPLTPRVNCLGSINAGWAPGSGGLGATTLSSPCGGGGGLEVSLCAADAHAASVLSAPECVARSVEVIPRRPPASLSGSLSLRSLTSPMLQPQLVFSVSSNGAAAVVVPGVFPSPSLVSSPSGGSVSLLSIPALVQQQQQRASVGGAAALTWARPHGSSSGSSAGMLSPILAAASSSARRHGGSFAGGGGSGGGGSHHSCSYDDDDDDDRLSDAGFDSPAATSTPRVAFLQHTTTNTTTNTSLCLQQRVSFLGSDDDGRPHNNIHPLHSHSHSHSRRSSSSSSSPCRFSLPSPAFSTTSTDDDGGSFDALYYRVLGATSFAESLRSDHPLFTVAVGADDGTTKGSGVQARGGRLGGPTAAASALANRNALHTFAFDSVGDDEDEEEEEKEDEDCDGQTAGADGRGQLFCRSSTAGSHLITYTLPPGLARPSATPELEPHHLRPGTAPSIAMLAASTPQHAVTPPSLGLPQPLSPGVVPSLRESPLAAAGRPLCFSPPDGPRHVTFDLCRGPVPEPTSASSSSGGSSGASSIPPPPPGQPLQRFSKLHTRSRVVSRGGTAQRPEGPLAGGPTVIEVEELPLPVMGRPPSIPLAAGPDRSHRPQQQPLGSVSPAASAAPRGVFLSGPLSCGGGDEGEEELMTATTTTSNNSSSGRRHKGNSNLNGSSSGPMGEDEDDDSEDEDDDSDDDDGGGGNTGNSRYAGRAVRSFSLPSVMSTTPRAIRAADMYAVLGLSRPAAAAAAVTVASPQPRRGASGTPVAVRMPTVLPGMGLARALRPHGSLSDPLFDGDDDDCNTNNAINCPTTTTNITAATTDDRSGSGDDDDIFIVSGGGGAATTTTTLTVTPRGSVRDSRHGRTPSQTFSASGSQVRVLAVADLLASLRSNASVTTAASRSGSTSTSSDSASGGHGNGSSFDR